MSNVELKQPDHAGFRLIGTGTMLILAIWLGHCGGLTEIRREACIYKTGNPDCRPNGAPP